MKHYQLHRVGNTLGLITINLILLIAFYDQLFHHQFPCPLCLLQRVCFIGVALGMALNLYRGVKTRHYGLMMLAALIGFSIAFKQTMLHILPGDSGYGDLVFGMYLYAWAAISFGLIIGFIAIALLFEHGFGQNPLKIKPIHKVVVWVLLFLIAANAVSSFLECGLGVCPSDPMYYRLLH